MREQHAGALAVGRDLGTQEVQRLERALVAQPLHEADADRLSVEIAIQVEMCVSITVRPDVSTVGRVPMLVTDACTMPAIRVVVA